jgi:type IV secretory pathway TrbD component
VTNQYLISTTARAGLTTVLAAAIILGFLNWGTPLGVVFFVVAAFVFVANAYVTIRVIINVRRHKRPERNEDWKSSESDPHAP